MCAEEVEGRKGEMGLREGGVREQWVKVMCVAGSEVYRTVTTELLQVRNYRDEDLMCLY